jgi:SagB-type dehydrogenase family enzyme
MTDGSSHGFAAQLRSVGLVYGASEPALDDPAELFHEASKAYPGIAPPNAHAFELLESNAEVRAATARATKRHEHLPRLALPEPRLPWTSFAEVVSARASVRAFGGGPVGVDELSALLHAGYGATHAPEEVPDSGWRFRAVPSGGALYPLEVYVVPRRVEGVESALYHYDPLAHALERLRDDDVEPELREALIFRELLDGCAVVLLVTAMFWRTRFKYGLRGYRFALLEAGHLAQNVLLAATALGLGAAPVGGFYDRRLDELLGVDGVNESSLYAIFAGGLP